MRLTLAEYHAHEARIARLSDSEARPATGTPPGEESRLHDAILAECARLGYYVVHSRMDRPATNGVGTPDFIVFTPTGVIVAEAKTRTGKLSPAQLAAKAWLRKLGHTMHVVRSLPDFLNLIQPDGT